MGSSRTFDGAGRIASQAGTGIAGVATYTYDAEGRKSAEDFDLTYAGRNADGTYTYSDDGRLKTSTAGVSQTASWDVAGNLTAVSDGASVTALSYDASNRLISMGSTAYGWDTAHGWRTSMRRSGESSVCYSYTGTGRLAGYIDRNAGRATTATYDYDAAGQRIASHVSTQGATLERRYTYEGLTLLSVGATSSVEGTWSVAYLYDEEGRAYAGVYRQAGEPDVAFGVVTNDRGDVVELIDSEGVAFAAYSYDAWGNPLTAGTLASDTAAAPTGRRLAARQPLRYAGYCWDDETSMYYVSARTYDPASRQFLTKDPAKADGEESAYQYCGGDPVGKVDPSGLHGSRFGGHWHPGAATFLGYGSLQRDWKRVGGRLHYRWKVVVWAGYNQYASWAAGVLVGTRLPVVGALMGLGEVIVSRARPWYKDNYGYVATKFQIRSKKWRYYHGY